MIKKLAKEKVKRERHEENLKTIEKQLSIWKTVKDDTSYSSLLFNLIEKADEFELKELKKIYPLQVFLFKNN